MNASYPVQCARAGLAGFCLIQSGAGRSCKGDVDSWCPHGACCVHVETYADTGR